MHQICEATNVHEQQWDHLNCFVFYFWQGIQLMFINFLYQNFCFVKSSLIALIWLKKQWIESADKNLIYFRERTALHISAAAFLFKCCSERLHGQKGKMWDECRLIGWEWAVERLLLNVSPWPYTLHPLTVISRLWRITITHNLISHDGPIHFPIHQIALAVETSISYPSRVLRWLYSGWWTAISPAILCLTLWQR